MRLTRLATIALAYQGRRFLEIGLWYCLCVLLLVPGQVAVNAALRVLLAAPEELRTETVGEEQEEQHNLAASRQRHSPCTHRGPHHFLSATRARRAVYSCHYFSPTLCRLPAGADQSAGVRMRC